MIGELSSQGPVIPIATPKPRRALKKLPKTVTRCADALVEAGVRLRLMLQDEGRFGRISMLRRCWAPRGVRPCVPSQIVREYTYAYAAVSPHDGTMESLILPELKALAQLDCRRSVDASVASVTCSSGVVVQLLYCDNMELMRLKIV